MPRPREFDTEILLEKVLLIFLENGLQRTSMRQLEATTGVKQVSLYNAYDNKEGLFLAVFDRYAGLSSAVQDEFLDNRGLEGIAKFARAIVTPESPLPYSQYGCLIINTALVAEAAGPVIKKRVESFRLKMHTRFVAAFERARSRGKLRRGLNLDQCAELVISAIWGIFITIRLADNDQIAGQPAAKALCKTLRDWARVT